MDRETFNRLLDPQGQAALEAARRYAPTEATFLSYFEKLKKQFPPDLAKAALETTILREKARAKFSQADRMYFTREALEQATSEPVARHRARRFAPFKRVVDLCCGIGGDALALAEVAEFVTAVDSDPLRVAIAEANAAALGLANRIGCQVGNAVDLPLPGVEAVFADPSRRAEGRRHLNPEDYTPPLSALRARFASNFPLAIKVAPGVARGDLPANSEFEFVSLGGELKECVLWFGPLRTTAFRATLLPEGATLAAEVPQTPRPPVPVGAFLYDPDPAVTRAGLVHDLAGQIDAAPIDFNVQLLTALHHVPTSFASAFAVELAAPVDVKKLREYLRARQVGRVTVVKRGSLVDADEIARKLKLDGPEHRTLILTVVDGRQAAIIAMRLS